MRSVSPAASSSPWPSRLLLEHPARRLDGLIAMAIAVHRAALVRDGEGHLAGLDLGRVGLDPHVAEADVHVRLAAEAGRWRGQAEPPPFVAAPPFGAFGVARTPRAPLTMSPNAWVTNG